MTPDPISGAPGEPRRGRRVLVGIGNRDRGDDGIGPAVCVAAGDSLGEGGEGVEVWVVEADPTTLAVRWSTDDHVVVVDAVVTGAPAGTVHELDPDRLAGTGIVSTHGLGVAEVVRLSTALGTRPARLEFLAVEAARFDHGAALSPEVAAAVHDVVARAVALLRMP